MNFKRLVIDFLVEFPDDYSPEFVAGVVRDYIHINRFTVGLAQVTVYPPNTRVIQNPIVLPSEESATKH